MSIVPLGLSAILEYYTLILLWFQGAYYNNLYVKSQYIFLLGCIGFLKIVP